MDCVVGSGPAGVACAAALLEQGREVCLVDAGLKLEAEREVLVQRLAQLPPESWSPGDLRQLKGGMNPSVSGIPDKLIFGSDFPYREAETQLGLTSAGVGLRASLALGGLSNVWGAAMLPYRAADINDWPISVSDLATHYVAALNLTGLAAGPDDLAEMFPLYSANPRQLKASRQAQKMLSSLERSRQRLQQAGIHFGRSRLAVQGAAPDSPASGCVHCGLCLSGCVYDYIYNSQQTIKQLEQRGRFRYENQRVVETVSENAAGVTVTGHHLVTRTAFEITADRVYLAGGVLPTTGILLRSLAAYDRPVDIKDSQYFLLPLALVGRVTNVREERLHALSQIFLEVLDPEISARTVHLQVYSYNDLIGQVVRKTCGPLDFLARELEGRLLLVQGFIHSDDSGRISATLRRATATGPETLELKAEPNLRAKQVVRRIVRKLLRHAPKLGAVPLPMLLQMGQPGRSFHAGSSFPMRTQPGAFETDIWGRLAGGQRIHAVDATVLPTIPATTITLTAMANAHRIGSAVNRLEAELKR